VYEGSTVAVGNVVAQAATQASNGNWVAQPFVLATGTEVKRVRLYVTGVGANADVNVSLRADNSGNPSGTSLVTILLPKEFFDTSPRWVDIPLIKTGLTNGATYWIVTESGGDGSNRLLFGTSGAVSPSLKTSSNGSTWVAGATQMLHTVSTGTSGLLVAATEDSGAAWFELTYDGSGNLTNVGEYVGGFRNKRTLTYSSGTLTGVS
jgi:hypothetical protein